MPRAYKASGTERQFCSRYCQVQDIAQVNIYNEKMLQYQGKNPINQHWKRIHSYYTVQFTTSLCVFTYSCLQTVLRDKLGIIISIL